MEQRTKLIPSFSASADGLSLYCFGLHTGFATLAAKVIDHDKSAAIDVLAQPPPPQPAV